jgi:hypothetical protein
MIFGAVPAADDIFRVYASRLTDSIYHRFHLPVPLLRGRGLSLLPRKVPLRAFLSAPLRPPPYDPAREEAQVDALHAAACAEMAALLRRG